MITRPSPAASILHATVELEAVSCRPSATTSVIPSPSHLFSREKTGSKANTSSHQTSRVQDKTLNAASVTDALKFLVHFIGDIHQPLHDEGLDRGGNQIPVTFDGKATNLHATWDTSIPQKLAGIATLPNAHKFAATLTTRIKTGAYKSMAAGWLKGIDINDPVTTATGWAAGANGFVCSLVLKDGITVVEGQDLGGAYFTKASPAVEMLLAQAGYRLAAWLDLLATGSVGMFPFTLLRVGKRCGAGCPRLTYVYAVGANKTARRAHVGIVERSSLLEREPGLFDVDGDTCERALE